MKKEAATAASLPEVLSTFGLTDLTDVTSVMVKLGYHEARKLLTSSKKKDYAQGLRILRQIAQTCEGLSRLYTTLGYSMAALRAIEIAGTCWGQCARADKEEAIAHRELGKLIKTGNIDSLTVSAIIAQTEELSYSLDDDMAILLLQMLAKHLKYRSVGTVDRKDVLQLFMYHDHPDTIGRWLWAVECLSSGEAFKLGQLLKEKTETFQPYTKPHTWQAFEKKMEELSSCL
jgi:replicative superfamily II helicase